MLYKLLQKPPGEGSRAKIYSGLNLLGFTPFSAKAFCCGRANLTRMRKHIAKMASAGGAYRCIMDRMSRRAYRLQTIIWRFGYQTFL